MSHVTGGGLANNLARVVPDTVRVRIDRASWTPPPVFDLVADVGRVPRADLEATLNLGVGMVALVPPDAVDDALRTLADRGLPAWVCGEAEGVESGARRAGRPGRPAPRALKRYDSAGSSADQSPGGYLQHCCLLGSLCPTTVHSSCAVA